MKHAKKLASLLLALVMVFSLAATAFAAQEGTLTGGSITIDNAVVGQEYSVYQILYLESYDKDSNAYAYKANSAWASWLETQTTYVSVDASGYVTWVEGADAAAFAKLAQAYAKENNITADGTQTKAEGVDLTFSDLKLGYYLVDSTLGTLCSLDTTNPNVTINEKNEVPTNVKTVQEDSDESWGSENDADIGQTVYFKSTITIPVGSENVVFHDSMSEGLTFENGSVHVYTDEALNNELDVGNYTLTQANLDDGCTFEISFKETYLNSLTGTATVYVTYTAVVDKDAVIGNPGNPNDSYLSYGDENNTKTTPKSTTTTYTWEVDVLKYCLENGTKTPLAGAGFELYYDEEQTNKISLYETENGSNIYQPSGAIQELMSARDAAAMYDGMEDAGTDQERIDGVTYDILTDDTGKFTIQGLDSGTYYLFETKAPDGYNQLTAPIVIVIDEDGTVTVGGEVVQTVEVLNQSGTQLPSTGGMGTTIFYVVGTVLVLGAAVLLITKKRMSANQ